uniref:Sushi domain-containing protein n=1 Tax=Plectus sambesii TaxID=2011161 RepID=A0A914WHA6_9BILA
MCLNPGTEICYDENQSTGNTCKFDCDNDISRCIYEKFESTVLATTEPLVDCAVTYSRNGSTFATQSFSLSFACGNGEWYSKERPVPPCTNTDHEEIVVGRDSNNNDITCLFNCAHSKTSCHLKRFGEELTQAAPVTIGYCDGEEFTNFTTNQTTTTFNCSEHHVEFEWTGDCNSDEEKTLYTDKNKTLTCLYNCSSDSIPPRCQLIYTASPEKLGASAAAGLPAIWTILIIMAVLATLIFIALLAVRWYIDKRARKTGSFDVAYHNNSNTVCTNPDR